MSADDFDLIGVPGYAEPTFGMQSPGGAVMRVHPESVCAGESCCIHSPSDHHMREWPMNFRSDIGVMERTCPHGVGHPDPDDLAFHIRNDRAWVAVHGCCGCCRPIADGAAS